MDLPQLLTGHAWHSLTVSFFLEFLFTSLILRRFWKFFTSSDRSIPLPGPMNLPVVGCLLPFLLTNKPEIILDQWAKKYGPVYSLWLGNQRFVILSDANVVKDLLVSNSTIFSSRKDSFIKCQTILAGRAITATSYNDKWRAHRAIAKRWLDQSAVDSCTGDLAEECTRMLQQICPGGIDAFRAVDCYVANNILRTAFATSAESLGPATYERLLELIWEFVECTNPMSNAVDFIPLLQYLPNPMTKRAKRVHAGFVEILGKLLDDMDERLEKGEVVPDCLAKTLLERREKKYHDRLDMIMLCSAFIIPGFASVTSVLRAFVLEILKHPEVQERAHEELDRVVGADRLPTVDDEENLPYIRSIIKEVERLRNPLTLGTPHFSTEDFVYHGHLIPKNAVVVVNTHTIHHNPERYLDPEAFIPERYLNDKTSSSESVNSKDPMQRDHWSFGAGRRICPGMRLAEREIFLAASYLLWAFYIETMPEELVPVESKKARAGLSTLIKMTPRHDGASEVIRVDVY